MTSAHKLHGLPITCPKVITGPSAVMVRDTHAQMWPVRERSQERLAETHAQELRWMAGLGEGPSPAVRSLRELETAMVTFNRGKVGGRKPSVWSTRLDDVARLSGILAYYANLPACMRPSLALQRAAKESGGDYVAHLLPAI